MRPSRQIESIIARAAAVGVSSYGLGEEISPTRPTRSVHHMVTLDTYQGRGPRSEPAKA